MCVYRDSALYFSRLINDVTVPLIAGLFGFVVVFQNALSPVGTGAIVLIGVGLALFWLLYQVRTVALD